MNIKCKHCGSDKIWKYGKHRVNNSVYQKYYCRECCKVSTYRLDHLHIHSAVPVAQAKGLHSETDA
jgi:transposase-like protein